MSASKNINPSSSDFAVDTNAGFDIANPPAYNATPGQRGVADIIDRPRNGKFVRELVTWRTPHLGYVQMYINPSQLTISDAKDINSVRTKSGFVMQYGGEKLTQIAISGTTGSAGIEGINILEQIYRAEQYAFDPVADALRRQVSAADMAGLFSLSMNTDVDINSALFASQFIADNILNMFQQPFPTLASLAASIEMFFQGVLYKGYFNSFTVTESTSQGVGIFEYSLNFTAYAKQGYRRNFMPWHKQPFGPSNSNSKNDYSFYSNAKSNNPDNSSKNEETNTFNIPDFSRDLANVNIDKGFRPPPVPQQSTQNTQNLTQPNVATQDRVPAPPLRGRGNPRRVVNNALSSRGRNLLDRPLRDFPRR